MSKLYACIGLLIAAVAIYVAPADTHIAIGVAIGWIVGCSLLVLFGAAK